MLKIYSCFLFILITIQFLYAQSRTAGCIRLETNSKLSIFDGKPCISDQHHELNGIFEQLYKLTQTKEDTSKLVIMHIGDSHMQGGMLSGGIRNHFHQHFGNAGRGLIVPYRLSKSNEPRDYSIKSNVKWQKSRCIEKSSALPIGVGGISVATDESKADLHISVLGDEIQDYSFNKIRVFGKNNTLAPGTDGNIWAYADEDSSVFVLNEPTNSIDLYPRQTSDYTSPTLFGGVSLENSHKGVLYHAIGANGAHYQDYVKHSEFFSQAALLKPNLIIVSLGTNEAFGGRFNKIAFVAQLEAMVAALHYHNLNAVVMLTTPAEVFIKKKARRKTKSTPNYNCDLVADAIVEFALAHHLPVWDMNKITGGEGSAKIWLTHKLLRPDRIHFTEAGYTLQADLFFKSFITNYNLYVESRH
jgi:lysophospholipase L1-like esterase